MNFEDIREGCPSFYTHHEYHHCNMNGNGSCNEDDCPLHHLYKKIMGAAVDIEDLEPGNCQLLDEYTGQP